MAAEALIKEMCDGCGWTRRNSCHVIKEPRYINKSRNGKCFAKATPERAKQIEKEIEEQKDFIGGKLR